MTSQSDPIDCSSKGLWETELERLIKEKAEAKRSP